MLEVLETKRKRHKELETLLADPKVLASPELYKAYAREYGVLGKVVTLYDRWCKVQEQLEEAKAILAREADPEFQQLARDEEARLEAESRKILDDVSQELVADEDDLRDSAIMEIRAGTGGEEASLFASDLFRMYSKLAERRRWKVELLDANRSELNGFKQVIFAVKGEAVYRILRSESGCHRVQRVPTTESAGRIHTSTVTVAVLPEVEEVQLEIAPSELKVDTFHASGPGGQNVNKVASAVRITHLPTGVTVQCQDEKSQHQNRIKAMRILRSRIYSAMKRQQKEERDNVRRSQIGTGERSEKIRTYNFPQNRVTDHRINLSLYNLGEILEGNLDELLDVLLKHDMEQRLASIR